MADSQPSFECRDVSVTFDSSEGLRPVLDAVSFEVGEAEFVSVMGRSGTGKTTLLRVMGGLLEADPTPWCGTGATRWTDPPEGVMFVFQNYAASLLPWRTVARNASLGLEGRVPRPEIEARVAEALADVGLGDRGPDYPWQLSGGMQQRVQLARSLAMRSSVLLMDEPFGSLDAMTKAALQDQLQRVHQQTQATVAFVTHDVDEAVYLSDRILILEGIPASVGQLIEVDLPRPRSQIETKELPQFLKLRRRVYDAIVEHE